MMVYLNDCCLIPPIYVLWGHRLQPFYDGISKSSSIDSRYVHRMIAYNKLSRVAVNEIIVGDDVVTLKTLIPEKRLLVIRKLEMESRLKKIACGLDYCSIGLLVAYYS
jgi:hypothetical protein